MAQRKSKEISTLLEKVGELVESYVNPNEESQQQLSNILPCLPKELSSIQNCNDYLDSTLKILLEEQSKLQYKNDKSMNELSKKALGLLLHESGTSEYEGAYTLQPGDLSSHLTFDRIAMDCINLLPSRKEMHSTKNGPSSIYDILNKCQTRMGSSLLQTWCRQPLIDLQQINQRHEFVEFLLNDSVTMDVLRTALKGVLNLDDIIQKVLRKSNKSSKSGLRQLYQLYIFVDQTLPLLIEALPQHCDTELLQNYANGLRTTYDLCQKFHALVEEVLDLDKAPEQFLVKASHSEELADIRRELDQIEIDAEELREQMNSDWNAVSEGQVKLEVVNTTLGVHQWRFRLTSTNHLKVLNSEFEHIVENVKVQKNGVHFATRELKALGDEKTSLLESYDEKQADIVERAMEVVE